MGEGTQKPRILPAMAGLQSAQGVCGFDKSLIPRSEGNGTFRGCKFRTVFGFQPMLDFMDCHSKNLITSPPIAWGFGGLDLAVFTHFLGGAHGEK